MVALLPRDLEIFCVYLEGREMAGMLPLSWKWPRLTLKLHTRTLEIDGMQLEQVLIWKIRKLPILQDIQFKDGWEFLPILMTFLILQFQSISSKSQCKNPLEKLEDFFLKLFLNWKGSNCLVYAIHKVSTFSLYLWVTFGIIIIHTWILTSQKAIFIITPNKIIITSIAIFFIFRLWLNKKSKNSISSRVHGR